MSKTKQTYGMDFDDEASKLLEKALSSFDGIILGESVIEMYSRVWFSSTKSMNAQLAWRKFIRHDPKSLFSLLLVGDQSTHQQPSTNVMSAAQTLALALQQCKSSPPSPPDKDTAETINAWLENFMPVSCSFIAVVVFHVTAHRVLLLWVQCSHWTVKIGDLIAKSNCWLAVCQSLSADVSEHFKDNVTASVNVNRDARGDSSGFSAFLCVFTTRSVWHFSEWVQCFRFRFQSQSRVDHRGRREVTKTSTEAICESHMCFELRKTEKNVGKFSLSASSRAGEFRKFSCFLRGGDETRSEIFLCFVY